MTAFGEEGIHHHQTIKSLDFMEQLPAPGVEGFDDVSRGGFEPFSHRIGDMEPHRIIAPNLIADADNKPFGHCDAHASSPGNWWVKIHAPSFVEAPVSARRVSSKFHLGSKFTAAHVDAGDERLALSVAPFLDIARKLWTIRQYFEQRARCDLSRDNGHFQYWLRTLHAIAIEKLFVH
jgi:hypothetical protein